MIKQWKKISEEKIKIGYRTILNRKYILPNGQEDIFNIKDDFNVVCILALTKDEQVILAKQFRPGPEKVLLELPGGGIELDEIPSQAITREFLEETGYQGKIQFVGTSWHDGYSTRKRYNFVAIDCEKVADPEGDDTEFIEVVLLSLDDFKKYLRSGELTDVTTGFMGLDYLKLL